MAWVKTVDESEARGDTAEFYTMLIYTRYSPLSFMSMPFETPEKGTSQGRTNPK